MDDATLSPQTGFNFSFRPETAGGVGVITTTKGNGDNAGLTLIPYYAWDNRGIGEMRIWLPQAWREI